MRISSEKSVQKYSGAAFTLIEMIGVLAVIAILASLLIPKIFEAINNARINNALISYNTVKTACMDHYAKYGGTDRTTNGAAMSAQQLGNYDLALLSEGFLDKPFLVKVGTNSYVHVTNSASYFLDGSNNATAGATYIVEAIINGVPAGDAKDINDRLDGDTGAFAVVLGTNDTTGRVKWDATLQQIDIYITHR